MTLTVMLRLREPQVGRPNQMLNNMLGDRPANSLSKYSHDSDPWSGLSLELRQAN